MSGAGAPARPRWLLALASIAVALAAADTYIVVLALPEMMAGVGLGIEDLHRATPVVSGFLLGYLSVLPLVGRLSDLVPRDRVLQVCLALFVAGSVVTALAVELPVLVGGRVVQGAGGGGLVPATLALVADHWPPARRGLPLGVVGAVQEAGSVLGPPLGAVVLAVATWREIFWLGALGGVLLAVGLLAVSGQRRRRPTRGAVARTALVLLGGAALWLALAAPRSLTRHIVWGLPFVPFTDEAGRLQTPLGVAAVALLALWVALVAVRERAVLAQVDLPGALLLGTSLGTLVLAFASADPEREVLGPSAGVLLPASAVALAGYLWRHRTAAQPLVPRGLLGSRGVGVGLLVSACVGAALVAVVVDVPVLARLTLTDDQTQAALVLVRFLIALPVGALAGGAALRWLPPGAITSGGLLIACAGLMTMRGWGPGSLEQPLGVTAALAAAGVGLGLAIAPVNAAVLDGVPARSHGIAGGLVVLARLVGMVVGLALLTAVGLHRYYAHVAALPPPVAPQALLEAGVVQVQTVFTGGAIACLAGAAAAWALPRRGRG